MDPLFQIPEDFSALSADELLAFIAETRETIASVTSDPASFVNDERTSTDLVAAVREGAQALQTARETLAAVEAAAAADEVVELSEDEVAAELAEIAAFAQVEDDEDEDEVEETDDEPETAAIETPAVEKAVVASAKAVRRPLPKPSREREMQDDTDRAVSLTAAGVLPGFDPGQEFPDMNTIAEAMQSRRRQFGLIAAGTEGEKVPIARADWSHLYPPERVLGGDVIENMAAIGDALSPSSIKRELKLRRDKSLAASGGLCAPVTPYYQLAMISQASRPVRAALPSFNADRGGIRFARPAGLSIITTGVGTKTVEQDAGGGTQSLKSCQVVSCPDFEEVDVITIYHCLQFGNLGARTFPERVTQWNNLTLAAHARLAESGLLTGIDTASTQVTAASIGLGAVGDLLGQVLAAANGMRNRNRMDPEAVLRLMMPDWAIDLLVSDVIRSTFQRFDTDEARITALLRSFDIEPTFYIDGAAGRSQVFGAQTDGALLSFPTHVVWYLYPEGSFLYVDGGTLELGLVRDSVLNSTNDFQIFGETFENVAFVGVESLAVSSAVCDSGTTAAPHATTCPITY